MTKQEIIETIKKNAWSRTTRCYADRIEHEDWVLKNELIETNADTLLAKIEQEKKEQAREIIRWFANETEKSFGKNYLAERIAKEYGVEL